MPRSHAGRLRARRRSRSFGSSRSNSTGRSRRPNRSKSASASFASELKNTIASEAPVGQIAAPDSRPGSRLARGTNHGLKETRQEGNDFTEVCRHRREPVLAQESLPLLPLSRQCREAWREGKGQFGRNRCPSAIKGGAHRLNKVVSEF